MSDPDFFIVTSLLGNVASFRASTDMRKGDRLVRLEDHHARIAELQAQVEQLRTEAKVASDRIQELGRVAKAQRGEIEGLRAVRVALDRLVAHIGMDGEIDANHPAVHEALNALNAIDSARAGREDGKRRLHPGFIDRTII